MTPAEAIGTAGVALLLAAFALNLTGRVRASAAPYHALNAVGAGLACASAWMIGFLPFVVLEGVWALVASLALLRSRSRNPG